MKPKNLYKYSKIYSGSEPELIEGDIFKTVIPLNLSLMEMSDKRATYDILSDKISDTRAIYNIMSDKTNDKKAINNNMSDKIILYLNSNKTITASIAAKLIERSHVTARRILAEMVKNGILTAKGQNKNRTYILK